MDAKKADEKPAAARGGSPARRRGPAPSIFRPFTEESLARINQRIEDETRAKELARKQQEEEDEAAGADGKAGGGGDAAKKEEEEPEPNAMFEAGKTLPDRLGAFPPSLYGKPIEDLDEFYDDKYVRASRSLRKR